MERETMCGRQDAGSRKGESNSDLEEYLARFSYETFLKPVEIVFSISKGGVKPTMENIG